VSTLELRCPNGCDDGRFEALNAPLIVDRAGRYLGHEAGAATYLCERCQSVAIDLAAAAREMQRREESGPQTLKCPGCGLEMLPPEDDPFAILLECPSCETRFSGEEGMTRLHGGGNGTSQGWDEAP
jgi:hypothetical protein